MRAFSVLSRSTPLISRFGARGRRFSFRSSATAAFEPRARPKTRTTHRFARCTCVRGSRVPANRRGNLRPPCAARTRKSFKTQRKVPADFNRENFNRRTTTGELYRIKSPESFESSTVKRDYPRVETSCRRVSNDIEIGAILNLDARVHFMNKLNKRLSAGRNLMRASLRSSQTAAARDETFIESGSEKNPLI